MVDEEQVKNDAQTQSREEITRELVVLSSDFEQMEGNFGESYYNSEVSLIFSVT